MSTGKFLRLADRHNDLTRQAILDAALQELEHVTVSELTVRGVAKRAHISERTVFRYFASRDEFLDAVANETRAKLTVAQPRSLEELLAYPRPLFSHFERLEKLAQSALHSDLFHRIRESVGRQRWAAVRKIVDELAPKRSERERRIAAANIRYYLSASAWHYYRFYFRFSLEDTIAAAETAIRQTLAGLTAR